MTERRCHCCWTNALWLLLGIVFAISHTWSPLYFQNQNQYFLHGLAQAGVGHLKYDWLATTRDPTPIFSMFVEGIVQVATPHAFQVFFGLMLTIYFTALMWLVRGVAPTLSLARQLLVAAFIITIHSALLRYLLSKGLGIDYLWYFQCGVAGQYVLGPGLQPSVFGVFLVVAIAAYGNDRPVTAIFCAASAAVLHATYLLPAGLFTIGVVFEMLRRKWIGPAIGMGVMALSLVLPILYYLWHTFQPTDPILFAVSQDLLVNTRIPHHARIDCWLDIVAVLQLVWIAIGVFSLRGRPVFAVVAIMFIGAALLTVVQFVSGSLLIALQFPWRVSAILMPVATTIIFYRLSTDVPSKVCAVVTPVLILGSFIGGIYILTTGIGYSVTEAERGLIEHVARYQQLSDTYLLPVQIPKLKDEPAGSQSVTFNSRPRPANVIPWDFQRFRLATGAKTYVDFKSIPYADVDVIEWFRRMQNAERWSKNAEWNSLRCRWELQQAGITHVVVRKDALLPAERYQLQYADDYYQLYRIIP